VSLPVQRVVSALGCHRKSRVLRRPRHRHKQLQTALVLMDKLKSTYRELLIAAYRDTGEYKIPS